MNDKTKTTASGSRPSLDLQMGRFSIAFWPNHSRGVSRFNVKVQETLVDTSDEANPAYSSSDLTAALEALLRKALR